MVFDLDIFSDVGSLLWYFFILLFGSTGGTFKGYTFGSWRDGFFVDFRITLLEMFGILGEMELMYAEGLC